LRPACANQFDSIRFDSIRFDSIRFESVRVDLTGLLNGGPSTLWASRILTSRVSLTGFACACARASPTVSWAVCAPVGRIICRKAVRTTPFSLALPLSPRSGRALAYRRGAQSGLSRALSCSARIRSMAQMGASAFDQVSSQVAHHRVHDWCKNAGGVLLPRAPRCAGASGDLFATDPLVKNV